MTRLSCQTGLQAMLIYSDYPVCHVYMVIHTETPNFHETCTQLTKSDPEVT